MIFVETELRNVCLIKPELCVDGRGLFARVWCEEEFRQHGLNPRLVQCSISFNRRKGTLRGMHYQAAPFEEAKLVRCTMGAIYDVVVDLRSGSPTRGKWVSVELSSEARTMLYVPEGTAHGFQTLADDTEVMYQMSEFYHPECARGIAWNDPALGILWPLPDPVMSEGDRSYAPWCG